MNPEVLDRLPPSDAAAERCLLACILIDRKRIFDVADVLKPAHFYGAAHASVYAAMLAMHRDRQEIDPNLLVKRLTPKELEDVGGLAGLYEIAMSQAIAANAIHWAEIIVEKARLRGVILAGVDAIRRAYADSELAGTIIADTEAALSEIETGAHAAEPATMADVLIDVSARIDAIQERRSKAGVMIGLPAFDRTIGGLFPGELIVLAARTGCGKTSLACQVARHVAERDTLVYFTTLEMSRQELVQRLVCSAAGVNSKLIRAGKLTQEDTRKLAAASRDLARCRIVFDDRPDMTVADVRRACLRRMRDELTMIVVDYLGLVTPADTRVKRYEQIGQLTRGLKALARELDVPVLCLAQLNREADHGNERPRLSHLRESGSIEQDADMVLLLHIENKTEAELHIAKNRNGETTAIKLTWEPARTRFLDPLAQGFDEFSEYGG